MPEGIISFDRIAELAGMESRVSRKLLEWAFRFLTFDEFNEGYERIRQHSGPAFVDAVQQELSFEVRYNELALEKVPREGPLIVVANHPHGIIDGLILFKALLPIRPDLKVVVNDVLQPLEPLREQFLPVSRQSSHKAVLNNGRKILGALKKGTALLFFPAGSVAHFHLSEMRVKDKPWDLSFFKLISRTRAPIVPVFIQGRNSAMYHLLYNTWIRLSLVWLIREFLGQRGRSLEFTIGEPIPYEQRDPNDLALSLRQSVYRLGGEMP